MKELSESYPISQLKMTLKNMVRLLLSLQVCPRATQCYTTSNYMVKLFVFKLKQIYFLIIFFLLMAFYDTANTIKSTLFWTILVFI